jgi:hypothetical protein
VTLGQAVETDTGTALGRAKSRLLGRATETDTARAMNRARGIGQAVETDTGRTMLVAAITRVTLTGEFDAPGGAPARGWLRFTPTEPMHNGALTVAAVPVVASLDAAGEISAQLYATDDPDTTTASGDDPFYLVEELLAGQKPRAYRITLTRADTTQDLADLAPEG